MPTHIPIYPKSKQVKLQEVLARVKPMVLAAIKVNCLHGSTDRVIPLDGVDLDLNYIRKELIGVLPEATDPSSISIGNMNVFDSTDSLSPFKYATIRERVYSLVVSICDQIAETINRFIDIQTSRQCSQDLIELGLAGLQPSNPVDLHIGFRKLWISRYPHYLTLLCKKVFNIDAPDPSCEIFRCINSAPRVRTSMKRKEKQRGDDNTYRLMDEYIEFTYHLCHQVIGSHVLIDSCGLLTSSSISASTQIDPSDLEPCLDTVLSLAYTYVRRINNWLITQPGCRQLILPIEEQFDQSFPFEEDKVCPELIYLSYPEISNVSRMVRSRLRTKDPLLVQLRKKYKRQRVAAVTPRLQDVIPDMELEAAVIREGFKGEGEDSIFHCDEVVPSCTTEAESPQPPPPSPPPAPPVHPSPPLPASQPLTVELNIPDDINFDLLPPLSPSSSSVSSLSQVFDYSDTDSRDSYPSLSDELDLPLPSSPQPLPSLWSTAIEPVNQYMKHEDSRDSSLLEWGLDLS